MCVPGVTRWVTLWKSPGPWFSAHDCQNRKELQFWQVWGEDPSWEAWLQWGLNKTGKGGNHGAGDPQDGREGRNQAVRKDDYGVCKHSACGHQHSPFLRGPVWNILQLQFKPRHSTGYVWKIYPVMVADVWKANKDSKVTDSSSRCAKWVMLYTAFTRMFIFQKTFPLELSKNT